MITAGLNSGVSKLVGRAVHRTKLLNDKLPDPTIIGMTSWGTLPDKLRDTIQKKVERYYEIFIPFYPTFFSREL